MRRVWFFASGLERASASDRNPGQLNMDLRIDIELRGSLLFVTATGSLAYDAALRLLKQVCDTAADRQVNKILVNGLALDGKLSTMERYHVGVEVAAHLLQRQMNIRLAFVGKPPAMDGFGVHVAQNRGVTTEMLSTQQEALDWLDKWPG